MLMVHAILARDDSTTVTNDIGVIRFYGNDGSYQECARISAGFDGNHATMTNLALEVLICAPTGRCGWRFSGCWWENHRRPEQTCTVTGFKCKFFINFKRVCSMLMQPLKLLQRYTRRETSTLAVSSSSLTGATIKRATFHTNDGSDNDSPTDGRIDSSGISALTTVHLSLV